MGEPLTPSDLWSGYRELGEGVSKCPSQGGFEWSYCEEFSSVHMVWAGRGGRDRVSGREVCD